MFLLLREHYDLKEGLAPFLYIMDGLDIYRPFFYHKWNSIKEHPYIFLYRREDYFNLRMSI